MREGGETSAPQHLLSIIIQAKAQIRNLKKRVYLCPCLVSLHTQSLWGSNHLGDSRLVARA